MFCLLWSLWLWSRLLARSCQSPRMCARVCARTQKAPVWTDREVEKTQPNVGCLSPLPPSLYPSLHMSPSPLCLSPWPTSIHPPVMSLPPSLRSPPFFCFFLSFLSFNLSLRLASYLSTRLCVELITKFVGVLHLLASTDLSVFQKHSLVFISC